MRSRMSTEEEIKLVLTKIVNDINVDSKVGVVFDYTEDDLLDDYMELKESCHCTTIETPHGYKLINVIDFNDVDDSYNINRDVYIVFGEDKIYLHEADYVTKELTEEQFVENEKLTNQISLLEGDVNRAKYFLLSNLDTITEKNDFISIYKKACTKLNEFLDRALDKKSLR